MRTCEVNQARVGTYWTHGKVHDRHIQNASESAQRFSGTFWPKRRGGLQIDAAYRWWHSTCSGAVVILKYVDG